MRKLTFIATVATIALGALLPANAAVLLDLEDPAGTPQGGTPFALTFTAGVTSTTIGFAGYQVPSFSNVTNIGLFLNGAGPNLLGGSWAFTAAPNGSDASPFDDGTSVPALVFQGLVEDSFDVFSQAVATTAGQSYTLDFIFHNTGLTPSELSVTASDASVVTPLPATLPLFAGGLCALGVLRWRRRRKPQAGLA